MARVGCYLPDALHRRLLEEQAQHGSVNVSQILQGALEKHLDYLEAHRVNVRWLEAQDRLHHPEAYRLRGGTAFAATYDTEAETAALERAAGGL